MGKQRWWYVGLSSWLALTACESARPTAVVTGTTSGPVTTTIAAATAPSMPTLGATAPGAVAPTVAVPTTLPAATRADASTAVAATPTRTAVATVSATPSPTTAASSTPTVPSIALQPAVVPGLAGKLIFRHGTDLVLYRPRTGELRRVVVGGNLPRYSRDGQQLAFVQADTIMIAGPNGEAARVLVKAKDVTTLQWSPDGTRLLYEVALKQGQAGEIWTIDNTGGLPVKIGEGINATWAPDSKRVAYVTVPGDVGLRRTELRLVNWRGENGWSPVKDVPANAPPIGIDGEKRLPKDFEHVLASPIWNASGDTIYVVGLIGTMVETDFGMWERADAVNGGATFLQELVNVFEARSAPNREVALLIHSTARGDTYFTPQPLDGSPTYSWAATTPGSQDDAPAWAPDSQALAYYTCTLGSTPRSCDLVVRSAQGLRMLIPAVQTEGADGLMPTPVLDWAVDR